MKKPDDHTLTTSQEAKVIAEAKKVLNEAGAWGVLPTPIPILMQVAKVEEVPDEVLSASFIHKLRRKAGKSLKQAIQKVLGIFHASEGLIYLDHQIHEAKKPFIRCHEIAHAYLPWQRKMYTVVEDCERSLDPEIADLFDREANNFAAEVIFQVNTFIDMAEQCDFSIWTPIKLSKKFGASIYASIRQYVSKNARACAVLILNPPENHKELGRCATLRRFIASAPFNEQFGAISWPNMFTPLDDISAMIPTPGRKASGQQTFVLHDRNGDRHECIGEGFTQSHQVFILIVSAKSLMSTSLTMDTQSPFSHL